MPTNPPTPQGRLLQHSDLASNGGDHGSGDVDSGGGGGSPSSKFGSEWSGRRCFPGKRRGGGRRAPPQLFPRGIRSRGYWQCERVICHRTKPVRIGGLGEEDRYPDCDTPAIRLSRKPNSGSPEMEIIPRQIVSEKNTQYKLIEDNGGEIEALSSSPVSRSAFGSLFLICV